MKKSLFTIYLFLSLFSVNAQLKISTNGKVDVAGSSITNYGSLQINKDGALNGLTLTQSNNYSSYPFRIFRKGLTGYISRNDTVSSCFRMYYNGQISIGATPSANGFGSQLMVFGNNINGLGVRFYYPANNGGDGFKSCVEQPNNAAIAGWYTPVGETPVKTFWVTGSGNTYCSGSFIELSDKSIKSDIKSIDSPLNIIKKLNGVTYKNELRNKIKNNYKNSISEKDKEIINRDSTYDKDFANNMMVEYDKRDMGLIAQDVEKVLPDVVYHVGPDKKGIAYTKLIALLIEGIKAQQQEIDSLNDAMSTIQRSKEISEVTSGEQKTVASIKQIGAEESILEQNTPNPFNTSTQINYYLPENVQKANIYIFNMEGSLLLTKSLRDRGHGNITVNASELRAGMYIYSLVVDEKEVGTKRMILTN